VARALTLGVLLVGVVTGVEPLLSQPASPLAAFNMYLADVARLDASERKTLLSGAPVSKLLDADPTKEVAVFGAIWIRSQPAAYVERLKDIERFESGGAFRITKRISDPPRLADFAALDLPDDDFDDLRECRVGDCALKLGEKALQQLRAEVDWKKPTAKADVEAVLRRLAFDYVVAYQKGGNAALAVYRDADRPTFVANEFRSMVDRLPPLAAYLPDLKRHLLEYPRARLPDSSDLFYWQETQFGLKPTMRISHLTIQQRPEQTIAVSKMLYASHYFWTAVELRILLPDPARGPGFWFVTVTRSRSDGLSGFVGGLIRGRVRNEVEEGTLAALKATKTMLETPAR